MLLSIHNPSNFEDIPVVIAFASMAKTVEENMKCDECIELICSNHKSKVIYLK